MNLGRKGSVSRRDWVLLFDITTNTKIIFFLIVLLIIVVYPSLNYATGKGNSRTEALGKAFFCLSFASVHAAGLAFPPFTAHTNAEYSWTKNCHYITTLCICLFILKRCIYSVLSWCILLKHILCVRNSFWKQCWQDGGIVDPGCWDPHVSFMLHKIVSCFDYGRSYLPASKHIIRTIGLK